MLLRWVKLNDATRLNETEITMATEFDFSVNGRQCSVTADGATPLLLALRNDLGLRSTRHGCATGHCGACTVLVDGRPLTSCNTPVESVVGQSIETIENLEDDAAGKALMSAFINEQAGQCGYCLAGILIEAKALLMRDTSPSRATIADALDGHLCRCGAHVRILNAVERAAQELSGGTPA